MGSESYSLDTINTIIQIFEERVPFNNVIGMKFGVKGKDEGVVSFSMKDELVGNMMFSSLHGGVLATVIDAVGGFTTYLGLIDRNKSLTEMEKLERFSKIGTIDLRVDYIRPGKGKNFAASAVLLRTGKKIAVTRMEVRNEASLLIAAGIGTYIVG